MQDSTTPMLTRADLLSMREDATSDYRHARRIGNPEAMRLAVDDMTSIDLMLACCNNITIEYLELSN